MLSGEAWSLRSKVSEEGVVQAGQRAAAEDGGADGASGFVVSDANVAAARFFLDGHFRDDGHAHSGAHHAEDAAELSALKDDLGIEARAIASGHCGVAEAVTITQQEERFFA